MYIVLDIEMIYYTMYNQAIMVDDQFIPCIC